MKRYMHQYAAFALGCSAIFLAGCPASFPIPGGPGTGPTLQFEYERGYSQGFLRDDYYWEGFFDSYDSLTFEQVYYQGSDIPYLDEISFDAGFYDGLWTAYNDGYFTDYRYAFIIGWSEGYDAAFYPDYLHFLATDQHTENLNGGWGDGYNDGFSEGRVFGAFDFEAGFSFDWEDALLDYEDGVDLYFEEVDVGTGAFGPVFLYEYGTDPWFLKEARPVRSITRATAPSIRNQPGEKSAAVKQEMFRPLTSQAVQALNVLEQEVPRNPRSVRYSTTHLQRINQYLALSKSQRVESARAGERVVDAE